ncbi:MAG: hypothetical protein KDG55_15220 [Rhodocyclaceae bacterium]|nr:hypothetical protein [Rhodocyclaceae bacterium]
MNHRGSTHRTGLLRREIAALAARMMAEDGIQDYGFAKRKAARQLGANETESLPTNAEVEIELRAWQALYQDEEHDERLLEMRSAAASLMRLLEPFRPYLTGGVLDGTAGRFSQIDIDLFADSAKDVEIFFLNEQVRYEHREIRRPGPDTPEAVLVFDWEDVPVRLSIYPSHLERISRKGVERARLPVVEGLIRQPVTEIRP